MKKMRKMCLFAAVSAAAILVSSAALGADSSPEPQADDELPSDAHIIPRSEMDPLETEADIVDPNKPFVAYVSGVDTRAEQLETSNGDVNVLLAVNPETWNVLLLNTPRDYYIQNPAAGNAMDKLTHCAAYGIENSEKALGQLYGCDVDYYMQMNFEGFKKIIDSIGGVSVYSPEAFSMGSYDFVEGYNEMDGEKALAFARDRKDLSYGDNSRGRNQMRIIRAVLDKISEDPAILDENLEEFMEGLDGTFETDIPVLTVLTMVDGELSGTAQPLNVHEYAVTGHNGIDKTYSMAQPTNVMYQDPDLVQHASDLIRMVLDGETLTDDAVGEIVEEW